MLRPEHEAELERMREIGVAWKCANPIIESTAQIGLERQSVAMLVTLPLSRGEQMALTLVDARIVFASRQQKLDGEVLG